MILIDLFYTMDEYPNREHDKNGKEEDYSVSVLLHDTNGGWHVGWYNFDLKSWMHFGPEKVIDVDCWIYIINPGLQILFNPNGIIVKSESHD